MIARGEAVSAVVARLGERGRVISPLGYVTRDLYARSIDCREKCFFCLGSMGSVLPFGLGLSRARPDLTVYALEGDGALLMNLGTLVTLRRYGARNLRPVVFDNRCYESTGGQPSQPPGLDLAGVIRSVGLEAVRLSSAADLDHWLEDERVGDLPRVAVLDVDRAKPEPRFTDTPEQIASRFRAALRNE